MLKVRHNEPHKRASLPPKSISRGMTARLRKSAPLKNRTEENIAKMASAHAKKMPEIGQRHRSAREETRVIRNEIRELTAAQKRVEATLRTLIASLGGANGHRKRNVS